MHESYTNINMYLLFTLKNCTSPRFFFKENMFWAFKIVNILSCPIQLHKSRPIIAA